MGFYLLQSMRQRTWQMLWLTAASLFFYGWWNPKYLLLLALSASVNYSIGLALARSKSKSGRAWLILGVLFNLGMLAYFKYANWLLDSVAVVLDTSFHFEQIVLPLAISFYTFQQITYLADTRNGLTKPHGFLEYCLFVSFFPQLIAGPIVHHSEMLEQFEQLDKPADRSAKLAIGFSLLVIGLFKKVVVADTFAQFSSPMFALAANGVMLNTLDISAGLFSYAFQLYFDFSGYSDMAIGLACLFGIKLPVNFFFTLPGAEHQRLLAHVARYAVQISARLCLHPPGGLSVQSCPPALQPVRSNVCRWRMAWRRLDLRRFRPVPRQLYAAASAMAGETIRPPRLGGQSLL